MTFTKDDVAKLRGRLPGIIYGVLDGVPRRVTDPVRDETLRALDALEEARGQIEDLEEELCTAETKLNYAVRRYEEMAHALRAAEEG